MKVKGWEVVGYLKNTKLANLRMLSIVGMNFQWEWMERASGDSIIKIRPISLT